MSAPRPIAMISYDWSVRLMGGSIRALSFARSLPELGWRVVVLTASPEEEWPPVVEGVTVHHIPSPERGFGGGISADAAESRLDANPGWLKRVSRIKNLLPLERQLAWYPAFWRRAHRICDQEGVRAVVTVVAPNVMMPLGHHLARRLGVPHHIDLRDDFADRHLVERITPAYQRLLNWYGHRYARKADSLSVVSPVTQERLAGEEIQARLIMNGYVEAHFRDVPLRAQVVGAEGPLRVVHLGWLGDFRSIAPVVSAIARLDDAERAQIRLEHIGLIDPAQADLLSACSCPTRVAPQVSHAEAVRLMVEADVLLAIPGDRLPAAMSGKLFEYLRARRPILLVAGTGAARTLAERVGVDEIVYPEEVSALAQALRRLLQRKAAGELMAASSEEALPALERAEGARLLAGALEEVVV